MSQRPSPYEFDCFQNVSLRVATAGQAHTYHDIDIATKYLRKLALEAGATAEQS